jgi:hypothetical protein
MSVTTAELSRFRDDIGADGRLYYVVEVLSSVPNIGWIVRSEHLTQEAAELDLANCRRCSQ